MRSEQKRLILVLALFVVAGGVYMIWGRSKPALANSIRMVCVESGKVVSIARSKLATIPAENTETGRRTLFPVLEQDGKLLVDAHYAPMLTRPDVAEVNKYVDPGTLEVLQTPRR